MPVSVRSDAMTFEEEPAPVRRERFRWSPLTVWAAVAYTAALVIGVVAALPLSWWLWAVW